MCGYDIDQVMQSFRVVADTREQRTARAVERFKALGPSLERGTLDYGDYCGNVELPLGGPLYDVTRLISPRCCVERKMSLDELSCSLTRDRERFRKELERASQSGAKVYLLVEEGSYDAILSHRYSTQFTPNAFMGTIISWEVRYNLTVLFCKPGISGRLIREILYRDMKLRLERGEYG